MFYPSVPPVRINVPLLTGACSIFNSFVSIVSIVFCFITVSFMHVVMHFFHARLMREFNKV